MTTQIQKNGKRNYDNDGLYKFKGTRFNAWLINPEDVIIVGIDTNDKGHALYDERVNLPLDEGLVLNIMKRGVLNPVIVRKNPQGFPEVVDGRQRCRAAREANLRLGAEGNKPIRIPAFLKGGEYRDMFGTMIALNEIRQDDDKVTKARKAQRLSDKGYSPEEVALEFGVNPGTVKSWINLLTLEPTLLAAVERRDISASEALKAAGASEAKQRKLAEESRQAPIKPKKGRQRVVNAIPTKSALLKMVDKIKTIDEEAAVALMWAAGKVDEDFLMAVLKGERPLQQ